MAKKKNQTTKSDKNVNVIKEENVKEAVLGTENTENVENTALDEEKDEDTENVENTALDAEKDENVENNSLDVEKDEDTKNNILGVEKKASDIIKKALEEDTSNIINEDGQNSTVTSEEVEQPKPIEDNAEIDATPIYEKISESVKIGKGQREESKDNVENKDSQDNKQNSNDKINTSKHNISKLFGYYWNGQLMD